ncbi:rho GTPase-activating protein 31 [Poeciliopsis prolifica]|uniref:rho GTPase-activating protein 31 n=1 Tax=Poeciliopsis prolifica TaxID=188132 RepID=UPI002413A6D9|nr:rho GTPase-activating protein 31 [Poeciliopsis prolifica]
MKNKGNKQKAKKKGSENVFGCDLTEHLQGSGQDVPQVLQKCAEFIEQHGIVDGIYRLSGVTSNIQRLRQEFCSEACPDLTKEVYLQDIHCVGSLCKLYFRELPNPLLTYELYSKFTEAVSFQGDQDRLSHIQTVIKELPSPHFRTLEYLSKHLARLATLSAQTNMHTRNLALVWAPNLLRSKDIETSSGNGDMAFQEVRIQQSVIEFILNHTEQIFSGDSDPIKPKEGLSLMSAEKYATLPISGGSGPMKLMSLEEAQARSLSPNHPVHKERQRENSLPDTSSASLYHTVIEISDKRRFSGKSKKWKSIFNLGRSVESKGKLSRNGSVFIRAQGASEKAALRPSRSMESLCSSSPDDDGARSNTSADGSNSIFIPDVKSRTLGSDSLYDLNEQNQTWEMKAKKGGAKASWSSGLNQKDSPGASSFQKTMPEQLKVFKGDDLSNYKPSSPKNRRMLYSGSSRPSFPGSFFPLESSPRHQRRAVNISEPFAVSVPLRVSAVISSNSTPCRGLNKDKAATLKPCREPAEQSTHFKKSNTFPLLEPKRQEGIEKKHTEVLTFRVSPEDKDKKTLQKNEGEKIVSKLEELPNAHKREDKDSAPSSGEDIHSLPKDTQLDVGPAAGKTLWSDLHQELMITEPEINLLHKTFKPVFASTSTKLTMDVKSKRSRSSPSLSLLCKEPSSNASLGERVSANRPDSKRKQPSESDLLFCVHKNFDIQISSTLDAKEKLKPLHRGAPAYISQVPRRETRADSVRNPVTVEDAPQVASFSDSADRQSEKQEDTKISQDEVKKSVNPEVEPCQRLSVCLEERRNTPELANVDDEDVFGMNLEELDLVESWEDISSTKQWVTSPLHSPDVEELFNQLSPFSSKGLETQNPEVSSPENVPQNVGANPEINWTNLPLVPRRTSLNNSNATQLPTAKSSTTKPKNTASSQRFIRQMSCETTVPEKKEEHGSFRQRPCSLNLDLSHRCIRDISNQQNRKSSEFFSGPKGLLAASATVNKGHSELDLFLNDRQAPLRRNSAPVSVSSVRTAFMIKTCQVKAVPVVPPQVQYSQIPQTKQESDSGTVKEQEKEFPKTSMDASTAIPPMMLSDLKEELENKEPPPKHQKHTNVQKSAEAGKNATPELPVITRRHAPSLEVFVDGPRPNRGALLQRPSFRNRQRPQSLILLSPPFPFMDYPTSGDDGKLLSSIKSLNDTSALNVFSKEMTENFRTQEGLALQNKMTIPKSGQRLETSTSCFYQPQRRSMIFDSRSPRQIE